MAYPDENSEYQHDDGLQTASSDYYLYQEQVDLQTIAQPSDQPVQQPQQQYQPAQQPQQYQPAQQPPEQQYQPAQQAPQAQYQPAQRPPQPQYQPAQQPPQPQYQSVQKPPLPQYQPAQQWQYQPNQNSTQYQPAQKPPSPYQPAGSYTPRPQNQIATEGWSTGFFGCLEDPTNALITAFCPCVTFGQIAEIIDNGHSSCATSGALYFGVWFCIAMPCLLSYSYRTKLRSKYNLIETPAPDCLTHCFCEPCALCQEYRELQHRGLDPSIGWQGNLALQQQQNYAMTPPMNHSMMQ